MDVYANGKFQAMFGVPSGLHMLDVKGREVNGFPLAPSSDFGRPGLWWITMAIASIDTCPRRTLLDSLRTTGRKGERTPGWAHRPDAGIDIKSPVRHIRHLRLGSRDYIYVGRDNGQVELLKRNGSTRATTPVLVHPNHPPLFRRGASLGGTSVLFIDDAGWVRERSLEEGEEVGISEPHAPSAWSGSTSMEMDETSW